MSRTSPLSYSVDNRLWQNYLKDETVSNEEEEMQFLMLVPLGVKPPTSPFQCVLCRNTYQTATPLKLHKRTHTGYKPFSCTICKAGFQTTTKARAHILKHLDAAKPVEEWCSLMEKLPIDQSVEEELIKSEVGPSALTSSTCILCKTPFKNENMMEHYRIHIGLRPFKCLVCQKGFSSESTIKLHCEHHLQEKKNEKIEKNVGNGSDASTSAAGRQSTPLLASLLASCVSSAPEVELISNPSTADSANPPTPLIASLLATSAPSIPELESIRSVSAQSGASASKNTETDLTDDTKIQSHFSPLTPVSNQTICDVEELDSEIKEDVRILTPDVGLKRSVAAISSSETGTALKRKHQYPIKPPPLPNRQRIANKSVTLEPPSQNTQPTTQWPNNLPGTFPACGPYLPGTFPGYMGIQPMVFLPSCSKAQHTQLTSTVLNSPDNFPNRMQPIMFLPSPSDYSTNQLFSMQMPPTLGQMNPGYFQPPNSSMGYPNSGLNTQWNGGFYPNMGSFQQISPHFSPHAPGWPDPRMQAEFNNQASGSSTRR